MLIYYFCFSRSCLFKFVCRLPKGMEQFFKQVEGILSIADVDGLSEKINAAGKDLRIEPYFEVNLNYHFPFSFTLNIN